ncbi:UNVERIFIED_CONTAM: hypothetical protein HDU68_002945 [Siphonaria sp. JEL0065]|nr:hypothetical protein HDU68_002945 [Siphonaria sp. JEL0065]
MPVPTDATTNIAVGASCVLLLVLYHVWLVLVVRHSPEKTVYGLSAHSRKAWVACIMRDHKKDILAVQSLRNLIMASSILASTCVAIIFGFIAFLATVVSHPESTDSNGNPLGSQFGFALDALFGPKVMLLLVVFCSMRFYNHVGLVININLSAEELDECLHLNHDDSHNQSDQNLDSTIDVSTTLSNGYSVEGSTSALNRGREARRISGNLVNRSSTPLYLATKSSPERAPSATSRAATERNSNEKLDKRKSRHLTLHNLAMFYTLGMRGYYISFPIMAYLWGPSALLATTILLIAILRIVDFNLEALSPVHDKDEDARVGFKFKSKDMSVVVN